MKVNEEFSNKYLLEKRVDEDVLICDYDSLLGKVENESLVNGTSIILSEINQIAVMLCPTEGIEIVKF